MTGCDDAAIEHGDIVSWLGADTDIPRGTKGSVTAVGEDGKARVKFPTCKSTIVLDLKELYCPDRLPEDLLATFEPGRIGIGADFEGCGIVREVCAGSQSETAGVKVGMHVHEVNGSPFTLDLLKKHIEGQDTYTVKFGKVPATQPKKTPAVSGIYPGSKAVLHGLQNAPELNGTRVRVGQFNAEKNRWIVYVDGKPKLFKEDNLEPEVAMKKGFLTKAPEKKKVKQEIVEQKPNRTGLFVAAGVLTAAVTVGSFMAFMRHRRPKLSS